MGDHQGRDGPAVDLDRLEELILDRLEELTLSAFVAAPEGRRDAFVARLTRLLDAMAAARAAPAMGLRLVDDPPPDE